MTGFESLRIVLFVFGVIFLIKGYYDKAYNEADYTGMWDDHGSKFRIIGILLLAYPVLYFLSVVFTDIMDSIVAKFSQPCP